MHAIPARVQLLEYSTTGSWYWLRKEQDECLKLCGIRAFLNQNKKLSLLIIMLMTSWAADHRSTGTEYVGISLPRSPQDPTSVPSHSWVTNCEMLWSGWRQCMYN